jgi:hypothetical protein
MPEWVAALLGGLALEVSDLLGLAVGALLVTGKLVLGLALALLSAPLALQRFVAGEREPNPFGVDTFRVRRR